MNFVPVLPTSLADHLCIKNKNKWAKKRVFSSTDVSNFTVLTENSASFWIQFRKKSMTFNSKIFSLSEEIKKKLD